MKMLVLDDTVSGSLIAKRKRLGQDRYDEVHAGRYIVNASPDIQHGFIALETGFYLRSICADEESVADTINVGSPDDFRVTDACAVGPFGPDDLWVTDGQRRVAVEVLSPREKSGAKHAHYRAHGVGLYIEIDPAASTVGAIELVGWQRGAFEVATGLADHLGFTVV